MAKLGGRRVVILSKLSDWKQMKYGGEWFYNLNDDIEPCLIDRNEFFDEDYVLITSIANEKATKKHLVVNNDYIGYCFVMFICPSTLFLPE